MLKYIKGHFSSSFQDLQVFLPFQKNESGSKLFPDQTYMKIKFLEGPYAGREFEFNSPGVTIGRDGGNQLFLDTDGVSRCHAELNQLPDGSWQVSDLNSTNGVKVNGVRIDSAAPVRDGDTLVIGENTLTVSQLSQEPARVIFNPIISTPPGGAVFNPVPESPRKENTAPAPEKKETPSDRAEKKESAKSAAAAAVDLAKLSGSLFGQKGAARNKPEKSGEESPENGAKKKRSNLIFYTVLICVVIMVLSSVVSIMNPREKSSARDVRSKPIVVRYEKEVIARDNVFRFDFQLKSAVGKVKNSGKAKGKKESGEASEREYTVVFTIDDIASQRHFTREVPLSDESVEELRQVIKSSGIYALESQKRSGESNTRRRLTVVEGSRILDLAVTGEFAASEFNAVEDEVIRLTEAFGLKTIAMTPKELIEMAERAFINAEDLYANRRAGAANLRDAIKNYQVAVESLEQFSPKPPRWEQARVKLAEALKERETALAALEMEYKRLAQLRSLDEMKPVFRQMMELTDPESREHSSARRRLIYIEQALRKKKR